MIKIILFTSLSGIYILNSWSNTNNQSIKETVYTDEYRINQKETKEVIYSSFLTDTIKPIKIDTFNKSKHIKWRDSQSKTRIKTGKALQEEIKKHRTKNTQSSKDD